MLFCSRHCSSILHTQTLGARDHIPRLSRDVGARPRNVLHLVGARTYIDFVQVSRPDTLTSTQTFRELPIDCPSVCMECNSLIKLLPSQSNKLEMITLAIIPWLLQLATAIAGKLVQVALLHHGGRWRCRFHGIEATVQCYQQTEKSIKFLEKIFCRSVSRWAPRPTGWKEKLLYRSVRTGWITMYLLTLPALEPLATYRLWHIHTHTRRSTEQ